MPVQGSQTSFPRGDVLPSMLCRKRRKSARKKSPRRARPIGTMIASSPRRAPRKIWASEPMEKGKGSDGWRSKELGGEHPSATDVLLRHRLLERPCGKTGVGQPKQRAPLDTEKVQQGT